MLVLTRRTDQKIVFPTVGVTVNVLSDGSLMVAGRPISREGFERQLADRRAQMGPDVEVRIRGDRGTAYRFVEPIMRSCVQQGIWNVTFAVFRPEDVR
jgi:biopolymer transport protein ExbD